MVYNELRKDYLLDRWVVIATERSRRPTDFAKQKTKSGCVSQMLRHPLPGCQTCRAAAFQALYSVEQAQERRRNAHLQGFSARLVQGKGQLKEHIGDSQ